MIVIISVLNMYILVEIKDYITLLEKNFYRTKLFFLIYESMDTFNFFGQQYFTENVTGYMLSVIVYRYYLNFSYNIKNNKNITPVLILFQHCFHQKGAL